METKLTSGPQRSRFPLLWKISLLVGVTLAVVAAVVGAVEGSYFGKVLLDGVRYVDVPAPVITGALDHVGLDPGRIAARLREAQMRLFGVTSLAMVLAIGIAWILVRQIISPLKRLTHLSARILEGDL